MTIGPLEFEVIGCKGHQFTREIVPEQIKLLGHLRDSGLLTNDEFEAEKQKILQGY